MHDLGLLLIVLAVLLVMLLVTVVNIMLMLRRRRGFGGDGVAQDQVLAKVQHKVPPESALSESRANVCIDADIDQTQQ